MSGTALSLPKGELLLTGNLCLFSYICFFNGRSRNGESIAHKHRSVCVDRLIFRHKYANSAHLFSGENHLLKAVVIQIADKCIWSTVETLRNNRISIQNTYSASVNHVKSIFSPTYYCVPFAFSCRSFSFQTSNISKPSRKNS